MRELVGIVGRTNDPVSENGLVGAAGGNAVVLFDEDRDWLHAGDRDVEIDTDVADESDDCRPEDPGLATGQGVDADAARSEASNDRRTA